jgi:hypothetical protein
VCRSSESGDFAAFRVGQRRLSIGWYGFSSNQGIDDTLH